MLEIADKVIDGIKAVRDVAKRIENAELQNQIADLIGNTADLKMEIAELKVEIIKLREENTSLKRKTDLRSKLRVENGAYYLNEKIDGYNQGPFCTLCHEKDSLLINVHHTSAGWHCPNCDKFTRI